MGDYGDAVGDSSTTPTSKPVSVTRSTWSDLAEDEFLSKVNSLAEDGAHILELDRKEISHRAASLLAKGATPNPTLLKLAADYLSDEQRELIRSQAESAANTTAGSFAELQSKVGLLDLGGSNLARQADVIVDWLDGQNLEKLDTESLLWLTPRVGGTQVNPADFSVSWQGQLRVPESGEYRISTTPFSLDTDRGSQHHASSTTIVKVDGKKITDGEAKLSLKAGVAPVSVEFSYKSSKEIPYDGPPVVQLFWNGPGIDTSIIPSNYLEAEADKPGLTGRYQLSDGSVVERVDPKLDFAWLAGVNIAPKYPKQSRELQSLLAAKLVTSAGLDYAIHDPVAVASTLSMQDQEELLERLARDSERLSSASASDLTKVYSAFRFASPNEAMNVVSAWMASHSALKVRFDRDFFVANRMPYRELAFLLGEQFPEHLRLLEDQVLVASDGSCCLPAAYTLCFVRHRDGRIDAWNKQLSKQVESNPKTASSWLIARAMGEELAFLPTERRQQISSRWFDGEQWLQEAVLMSDEGVKKAIAVRELVARLSVYGDFKAAKKMAEGTNEYAPTEAQDMLKELEQLEQAYQTRMEHDEARRAERKNRRKALREQQVSKQVSCLLQFV